MDELFVRAFQRKEGEPVMAVLENARHEKFVQCLIRGMSQRKAYREAFPASQKWKDTTVDVKASALFSDGKVLVRYSELQEELRITPL